MRLAVPILTGALGVALGLLLPGLLARSEPRPITPRGDLAPAELATVGVFERASPSVVYLTAHPEAGEVEVALGLDSASPARGAGSGFVWDAEGHIVTNFHVVGDASKVQVTLIDQRTMSATVVGVAPSKDLAVLKIASDASVPAIPLGTSGDLRVGQHVLAIGNPFGLDHSLTTGVVSAVGRTIRSVSGHRIHGVIQTDASINPGNSGGPLLDSAGRLVGVNTSIKSPNGTNAGIGFAVPVDTVNRVVPQLIRFGRVQRPHLGIRAMEDAMARRLSVQGVVILYVEPGGPAARAGLQATRRQGQRLILGDVIRRIGRTVVLDGNDLFDAIERLKPGDTVHLEVLRGEKLLQTEVTVDQPRKP